MRIYVAGKTHDIPTVRAVQRMATAHGHTITHDWTQIVQEVGGPAHEHGVSDEKQREYAEGDTSGVWLSDLVIACGHPDLCGTLWECGMAVAFRRPLWLYRWEYVSRHSVFEKLAGVRLLNGPLELDKLLAQYSEKRVERELAPSPVRVHRDGTIEIDIPHA